MLRVCVGNIRLQGQTGEPRKTDRERPFYISFLNVGKEKERERERGEGKKENKFVISSKVYNK